MKALSIACSLLLSGILYAQSSMIYKVEKEGKKTSYIYLNTITCGDNMYMDRLEKNVMPNIAAISVETHLSSNKNREKLQDLAEVTQKEQRLKNIVSTADYHKLVQYIKEKMGANEQMINMFKPFYVDAVLNTLDRPCGTSRGENINASLEKYADKKNLSYSELLSVSEYINLMDMQGKEYWNKNISYTFNNSDEVKNAVKLKNKAYENGNVQELKKNIRI